MQRMVCTVVLALAACGGSSNNNDVDMAGGAKVCTTDGNDIALAPKYAVRAALNVNVKVEPNCSGAACLVNADSEAELLFLAEATQSGTTASMIVTPCDITIPKIALKGQNMPVELTVSEALIASVKPVTASGTLSGTKTCSTFALQPINLLFGASLTNPTSDPLPGYTAGGNPAVKLCGGVATTACDPAPADKGCVCDQDGDGDPGATLGAKNLPATSVDKVFVNLRAAVTLGGQVFPSKTASGGVAGQAISGEVSALTLEQKILGCKTGTTPCDAITTGAVGALNPGITQSVNDKSTFSAVAVGAGFTCAQVKAQKATLFQ